MAISLIVMVRKPHASKKNKLKDNRQSRERVIDPCQEIANGELSTIIDTEPRMKR